MRKGEVVEQLAKSLYAEEKQAKTAQRLCMVDVYYKHEYTHAMLMHVVRMLCLTEQVRRAMDKLRAADTGAP
jgi:hypothetical protein